MQILPRHSGMHCWCSEGLAGDYVLNNFGEMKIHFRQILHGGYALLLKVNPCGASPVMSRREGAEIFEVEYAFALFMDSVLYK